MDERDRERVEQLTDAGSILADDGKSASEDAATEWFDDVMIWQDELIGLTGRVDPAFCALLRPLNERFVLLDEDAVAFKDRQHRFNVSAIATQVDMLKEWLNGQETGTQDTDEV